MAKTSIEWTQNADGSAGFTWNPVTGCTRASAGCDNCYAFTMTKRLAAMGQEKYKGLAGKGHFNGQIKLHPDALDVPLRRKKPTTYFVNSMSDLFHKDVPFDFVDQVFDVMRQCPQHTFQVLTKRPERMEEYAIWRDVLPNVWMGTSVENQQAADERIPHLLHVPAAVRFLSCEPLLGPVDLWGAQYRNPNGGFTGAVTSWPGGVDWVIVGGESGPNCRPFNVKWARSIRDECQGAGVAFFMKQLGGHPDKRHTLEDMPADLRIREFPEVNRIEFEYI